MKDIRKALCENLIRLRNELGFTQAQVAEFVGVETATYNRWESGKFWPAPDKLERLAVIFEVAPFELIADPSVSNTKKDSIPSTEKLLEALSEMTKENKALKKRLLVSTPKKVPYQDIVDALGGLSPKQRDRIRLYMDLEETETNPASRPKKA